jgi:hypothetical protein
MVGEQQKQFLDLHLLRPKLLNLTMSQVIDDTTQIQPSTAPHDGQEKSDVEQGISQSTPPPEPSPNTPSKTDNADLDQPSGLQKDIQDNESSQISTSKLDPPAPLRNVEGRVGIFMIAYRLSLTKRVTSVCFSGSMHSTRPTFFHLVSNSYNCHHLLI